MFKTTVVYLILVQIVNGCSACLFKQTSNTHFAEIVDRKSTDKFQVYVVFTERLLSEGTCYVTHGDMLFAHDI